MDSPRKRWVWLAATLALLCFGQPAGSAPDPKTPPQGLAVTVTPESIQRYVGRPTELKIRVQNPRKTDVANIVVTFPLPDTAMLRNASDEGRVLDKAVTWNIGTLESGAEKTVSLTLVGKKKARKQCVARAAGDGAKGECTVAVTFEGLPALRLEVVDVDDPIQVGGETTYRIDVMNQGSENVHDVRLACVVPAEMKIVSADGPGKPHIKGQVITFPSLDELKTQQVASFSVKVRALNDGDVRFRVELRAKEFREKPIVEEESTRIYKPEK